MPPPTPGYQGFGPPPPGAIPRRSKRRSRRVSDTPFSETIPKCLQLQSDSRGLDDHEVNDEVEKDDLEDAAPIGSRCDNKDVFRVPQQDDPEKFQWTEEKPLKFGVVSDVSKTKKARETFAINVFHRFNEVTEEWFVGEVRINSTLLHSVLEKVLEGYPGVTQHDLKSFAPPFLPLFHRWQNLLDYADSLDASSETAQHVTLLEQVMEPLMKASFTAMRDVEQTGHVAFQHLNLLFVPGTILVKRDETSAGVLRSCQVIAQSGERPYYDIRVDMVDWDGRQCGLLPQLWLLRDYHGLREIGTLDVAPLARLPNKPIVLKQLIERGRKFEKLRGQFFLAFTDESVERVNERMIVDAKAYYKHHVSHYPVYASLSEIGHLTWAQSMARYSAGMPMMPGAPVAEDKPPMTDEQCLLTMPTVNCFNIDKKKWEFLKVESLHEIPWAPRAFDSLVLDQGEKDLVLALVDRDQFTDGKPFDDFIGGKGQGMIMLLCGPPGVGKTLTAETVSEHLRRPLYRLGAGDLGIDARAVETCLEKALKLCADFGAVLLIDEADVFMEARTTNNLQRNELVSVFLRLLEYYSGIMILTTNRMRSIDPAFESRIDITLTYSSLKEADRKQVWQNFLATLNPEDVDIDESELEKLAKFDFNGRQIKSAIKTARTLAAKKQEPLNARHLGVVLALRSKAIGMMTGEAEGYVLPPNNFSTDSERDFD